MIHCKYCGNTNNSIPGRSVECYTEKSRDECLNWKEKQEKVNHPQHYGGDTPFEVIKVLQHWLTPEEYIGFLRGNYIKYLARFHMKGGLEDLEKANWYLIKHIEVMKANAHKFPEDKRAFDEAWRDKNREHKRAIDRDYNRRRRIKLKSQNAGKSGAHDSDRHSQ